MRGVLTEITPSGLINTEAVRFEGCPGKYGRFEMITSYHETAEVMSRFDHEMRRRYERIAPSFDPFLPNIKNVIFNDPATIVIWSDDSKTVVKCQPGDTYSKELGLAMCISKKFLGNKGNFNEEFKKWIPEEPTEKIDEDYFYGSCETCKYVDRGISEKPCIDCTHNGGNKNRYKEDKKRGHQ